jgi:hypothetical protein
MLAKLARNAKRLIARSGIPPSFRLETLNAVLELGQWLRSHECGTVFACREDLYAHLHREVLGEGPIDFLEFGVYEGDSIRHWARLNRHPESRFFGFDSFTGLPGEWKLFLQSAPGGSLDAGGRVPEVADERVHFVKGYFQETLPGFLSSFEPRHRLLIHCDADLYSSTLYVLTTLHPCLTPGSILLFDEFSSAAHEFKAFVNYAEAFMQSYRMLAAAHPFFIQAAIELQGPTEAQSTRNTDCPSPPGSPPDPA